MMSEVKIAIAQCQDAKEILDIYQYYVENTAITFEYDVPTVADMETRMINVKKKFPYIVARIDGKIVGYAYAGAFRGRAAYAWNVETSIYVKQGVQKKGIGKKLYQVLEDILKLQGITNLYACIGYPKVIDEHLDKNSVEFHDHLGYRFVGEFVDCGYKFHRWYNMVWMEKMIGEHYEDQTPIRYFPDIIPLVKEQLSIE